MIYYLSKLHSSQLVRGNDYIKLNKTICIAILDFKLEKTINTKECHTKWNLRDKNKSVIINEDIELHLIELPKVNNTAGNIQEKIWLKYITNPRDKEVTEHMATNSALKQAVDEYEYFMADAGNRRIAELREKYIMDEKFNLSSAKQEGEMIGVKKGEVIGIKKGEMIGVKKGKVIEKQLIAKNLLRMNMSIEDIEKITELSKAEIKKIAHSL